MIHTVWPENSRQMSIKGCPKMISLEKWKIYKNGLKFWSKQLYPQALKSCPKCNKSPNLVTLDTYFPFSLSLARNVSVGRQSSMFKDVEFILISLARFLHIRLVLKPLLTYLTNQPWESQQQQTQTVWPNVAIFLHFGQLFKAFGNN